MIGLVTQDWNIHPFHLLHFPLKERKKYMIISLDKLQSKTTMSLASSSGQKANLQEQAHK